METHSSDWLNLQYFVPRRFRKNRERCAQSSPSQAPLRETLVVLPKVPGHKAHLFLRDFQRCMETKGAFRLTKFSGLRFWKFSISNGTVFFHSAEELQWFVNKFVLALRDVFDVSARSTTWLQDENVVQMENTTCHPIPTDRNKKVVNLQKWSVRSITFLLEWFVSSVIPTGGMGKCD